MRKLLVMLLAAVLILSAAAPAFADYNRAYTLTVSGNDKEVYCGREKADLTTAGYVNAKFFSLLNSDTLDRSLFDSISVDFVYSSATGSFTAVKETLVGLNGFSYVSSNPECVFIDCAESFHVVGLGRAIITVTNTYGEQLDEFTAEVNGSKNLKILSAPCSKCAGEQVGVMHILPCGDFSCEVEDLKAHGYAECDLPGHFKCDGMTHETCPLCKKPKCIGEHGTGICRHIHEWEIRTDIVSYPGLASAYSTYKYCPVCGAIESALPPYYPYHLSPIF